MPSNRNDPHGTWRPPTLLSVLLVVVGSLPACADFERGERADAFVEPVDTDTEGDTGAAVSFADVDTVLWERCGTCHASGGAAGSTPLVLAGDPEADYDTVASQVDTADPAASPLLLKGGNQTPHGGGAALEAGSSDWDLIIAWIEDGAVP